MPSILRNWVVQQNRVRKIHWVRYPPITLGKLARSLGSTLKNLKIFNFIFSVNLTKVFVIIILKKNLKKKLKINCIKFSKSIPACQAAKVA
jgi:hypothetical protein